MRRGADCEAGRPKAAGKAIRGMTPTDRARSSNTRPAMPTVEMLSGPGACRDILARWLMAKVHRLAIAV
jgi:hypothetical protein